MIDSLKLNEVRTVYDTQNPKIGSVISDAVEEKKTPILCSRCRQHWAGTIAPESVCFPKNLLVEGISDLVYLNHFSTILQGYG